MGPTVGENLNGADAGGFEKFVCFVLGIVAPYLDIVCGKGKGLHVAVTDVGAVGRRVLLENDLFTLLDSVTEMVDICGIFLAYGALAIEVQS